MPITISLTKQNASSLDYMFRAWVRKEDYVDTMLDCNINVKKFLIKMELKFLITNLIYI